MRRQRASGRSGRARRGPAIRSAALLLMLCLLALGVAIGIGLQPDPLPSRLTAATHKSDFQPLPQDFADEVDASLAVVRQAAQEIASPASGVVTQTWCQAGEPLTSGRRLIGVSGQPLLVLTTRIPPWRDFTPGMTGADVGALQAELRSLGYSLVESEKFDGTTASAVEDLVEDAGGTWSGTLPLGQMLWLPRDDLAVGSCRVKVGDRLTEETPIIALGTSTDTVTLKPPPGTLSPGARTLTIGETRVTLGATLSLADPAIQKKIK
ncbi:MAG: peptidoglycan-binding domain-containing protein, partial [Angustibacter sp.]